MNEHLQDSLKNTENALLKLKEALDESADAPLGSLKIDGTIQRFEFCIELMWKMIRRALLAEKMDIPPIPKQVLQKAYAANWISDEAIWLQMLDDRNMTSHTYNQKLAKEIFDRIKTYYPVMQKAYDHLSNRYSK